MGNCLITRLNGSVSNSSIPKIGEMRIKVLPIASPSKESQCFIFTFNKQATVEIIGDGYFTNETLTVNNGKKVIIAPNVDTSVYVSNGSFEIAIPCKYDLITILTYTLGQGVDNKDMSSIDSLKYSYALTNINLPNTKAFGDIDGLKDLLNLKAINFSYTQVSGDIGGLGKCVKLTNINMPNTQVSGDIGGIGNLTALQYLTLPNTQVSGDIGGLGKCVKLTNINMPNTQVSGDIGGIGNLTALQYLTLSNTQVSGDIGGLSKLTALTKISLSNINVSFTGDIGSLNNLTKLTEVLIKNSKLTGDLAQLPNSLRFASFNDDKGSTLTWSTRPSSAKIIAIQGTATISNIDKMLQDQAQCQVGFSANEAIWYKSISVAGTRTSASDEAVATLQQKGYTISIAKAQV